MNIAEKLIKSHVVAGEMLPGKEVGIRIDQTLTQDATGTMVYLAFESLGLQRVKTKLSVSYVDHNTLQTGFENADDHRFLQTAAEKFGVYFSPAGNGICHQVHLERFGRPGQTLLGSDSHTPTNGALGMLAIGAGGLDVALAMAGEPFFMIFPEIFLINLKSRFKNLVSSKDLILELLRMFGVKGGLGRIFEYGGDALKYLSVPERATVTNMGAELGLTTSVFPSDTKTKEFLSSQGRLGDYTVLKADEDAKYAKTVDIDLSKLEPLAAQPHSPDNVVKVRELAGLTVDQVAIGSCTNSSYKDLMTAARILKGRKVHKNVSLVIAPGSRQVLDMISKNGALRDMIKAGSRILETACGPCIGMGQAPKAGGISLRTFNRNFKGRSGTQDAQVYIVSPETAAVSAVEGKITDPRKIKTVINISLPKKIDYKENMIIPPSKKPDVKIERGKNIQPMPLAKELEGTLKLKTLILAGDNITTDHILPGGAKILPLRSNIPAIAEYVFANLDPGFVERAKRSGGGAIVAGFNYGQGSSREHAAIAPMYLGVRMVIAKSFARIHRQNLINYGIIPAVFEAGSDYDSIKLDDELVATGLKNSLKNSGSIEINDAARGIKFRCTLELSSRERHILLAGGLLSLVKAKLLDALGDIAE